MVEHQGIKKSAWEALDELRLAASNTRKSKLTFAAM